MKKYFLIVAGVVCIAVVSVFAQAVAVRVYSDYLGYHIGTAVNQKIGFYGATPVVRQTITNTAPVLIQVVDITGATNTIACYTTTQQVNQVRSALVNIGIASTTGN